MRIAILEISFVILLWASMLVEAIVNGRQAYGIDINPCLAPSIESFVLLCFGDYIRLREATRELVNEDKLFTHGCIVWIVLHGKVHRLAAFNTCSDFDRICFLGK